MWGLEVPKESPTKKDLLQELNVQLVDFLELCSSKVNHLRTVVFLIGVGTLCVNTPVTAHVEVRRHRCEVSSLSALMWVLGVNSDCQACLSNVCGAISPSASQDCLFMYL